MSGPEHYREAEQLLGMTIEADPDSIRNALMAAQVHATLALAAATAFPAVCDYCGDEARDPREWTKATS